jgi:hypothetical protein
MNQKPQFKIASALDPNFILDCSPEGKLVLWKWHHGKNQKWIHT